MTRRMRRTRNRIESSRVPSISSPSLSLSLSLPSDGFAASINYPRLTGERERQTAIITTTINASIIRREDRGRDYSDGNAARRSSALSCSDDTGVIPVAAGFPFDLGYRSLSSFSPRFHFDPPPADIPTGSTSVSSPSLSFRRSVSERFRRFAATPIYAPGFGVINAVVRLYARSLEWLQRERLTARNPVTPRRPSRPTRTYSYLVACLYRFAESQRATILLTFSSRRLRGVPVCESASRCSLASSSSRARSRRAKIHSRFPSVRTFLERETVAPNDRRIAPSFARYSTDIEAYWKQLILAYL